jgi:hypothetical protein
LALCEPDGNETDQQAKELTQLATSTLNEFHQAAPLASLETAISLHRDALRLCAVPHIERSVSLNGLALGLTARFYRTGHIVDLDDAISTFQEALNSVPASDRDRGGIRRDLSAALLTRFGKTSEFPDLEYAVSLHNESPNPGRSGRTNVTGQVVNNRIPEFHVRVPY